MRRFIPCLLLLINTCLGPCIRTVAQSPASLQIVLSKNYYFLSLLDSSATLQRILGKDSILQQLNRTKADSLMTRAKRCGRQRACFVELMQFSETEIARAAERIEALWRKGNELDLLLTKKLIPSGAYVFPGANPSEFVRKAWEQDARGINFAIDVYGNARRPNYPNIDSVDFKVRDSRDTSLFQPEFHQLLYSSAYILDQRYQLQSRFYSVPLEFALLLLDLNERDQAADYEPMELGINKPAVRSIKATNWTKYPYTVIVVPGAGPAEYGTALSVEGKLRCRLAAEYYRQAKAPFLIVSGGKVHPFKTTFNEAVEMKKYMVDQLAIPESAIITEPHARHTTTNMRNSARVMFKYGIPTDRAGLVATTRGQSLMVANTLADRCRRDIGYSPFRAGKVLSESLTEFFPVHEAFRIDPEEPMDP